MVNACLQHPRRTLAAVALATVVFAGAATRVETDNTPSAWLPEQDEARETYADFRAKFGGDTFLLVATGEVEVGAQATLSTLYDLSTRLGKIDGVVRVESPVTPRVRLARARANVASDLKLLADAVAEAKAAQALRPGRVTERLRELSLLQAEANASLAFLLFPDAEDAARSVPLYRTAQAAALEAIRNSPIYLPTNPLGVVADTLAGGKLPDLKAVTDEDPSVRDPAIRALFWWAFARGGETRARPRDIKLVRDLKRADAVMSCVLKRAPKTFGGGPHLYFAMRNLAVGQGLGGKPDVGLQHFEQVGEIAPYALLPVVLRAQFHAPTLAATPRGSSAGEVEAALNAAWQAFEAPLRRVIATPLAAGADDATLLANAAARATARALLDDPAEAGLIVPDGVKQRAPPPLPAFELRGGPGGRFLVATNGKRAALLAVVQPDLPPGPRARVVAAVEAELKATSGLELLLAGPELITHDLDVASQRSFGILFPVVIILMAGVLLFTLRRPRVVLAILACAGLTVVWTVGSLVLAGRTLNLILVVLPAILAVLTTAYSLHLVTRFLHPEQDESSADRVVAWRTATARTIRPCLLTALTTAAGFGSLAFSEIPPVRDLGLFAGLGVLISFGLTFTFLPALLSLSERVVPHGTEQANFWTAPRARSFVTRLVRHAAVVLFFVFLVGAWGGLGIAKLRYESHVLKFFPEDHRLPKAFAEIEANLFGMTPLEVWVSGEARDVLSATTIGKLEHLLVVLRLEHRRLVTRALVPLPDRALSPSTKAALLRAELKRSGGVPGYLVSSEGRVDLRTLIACRTTFSEEFHDMIESLSADLPPGIKLTGAVPLLVRTQALLVETQLRSFGTALLVVTLILLFTYGSVRLVLVSLLPNVLPIAITLGAMGYLGIPLNTATVTVAGIALGLVVHDTIHFLHHHHEARTAGATPAAAVAATLQVVGRPIVTTTLAVTLGFGAFAVSSFQPTHYFGLLIALTCVSALACDLIALPALLLAGERGVVDFGPDASASKPGPEPDPEGQPSPEPAPQPEIDVDDAPPAP